MIFFFLLLAVNLIPLFYLRSTFRFWIICIPLWFCMLVGFLLWRHTHDTEISRLEIAYQKSAGSKNYGDQNIWGSLEALRTSGRITNQKILHEIFFQTLVMWLLQIAGLRRTKRNYYFWLSWITGLLLLAALILGALMGIVPSGPLV